MTNHNNVNDTQTTGQTAQLAKSSQLPLPELDKLNLPDDIRLTETTELETNLTEVHTLAETIDCSHHVLGKQVGMRLDKLAATAFTQFSRAQLQQWITAGQLTVNHTPQKPKYRCKLDDVLRLSATIEAHADDLPEDIAIEVVYEDDAVIVVNKPVGMVVHPGAGNWTGTLVNALLYHYPNQSHLPRAGLVHRIDKDTSGLLIIGKTKVAQLHLMAQLKDKSVYRHYQCVVAGDANSICRHKMIDLPIARHPTQRTKMSVQEHGKAAVTHIMKVTPLCDNYSLLDVSLETGRTHQIRVHLSHLGFPLVGDGVYGKRKQLRSGLTDSQRETIKQFTRQALHAYKLGFIHPSSGEEITVVAELPEDIQTLTMQLNDSTK